MRIRSGALILVAAGAAMAGLSGSYLLPLDHPAIQYAKIPPDDAVTRLQKKIDSGAVQLQWDGEFGYLRSVLQALHVPQSSQVLVFSKTSFQAPRISPHMPRALYFNDEVQVGYVRTGDVLEFAALDPKQGVMFYTLDQEKAAKPQIERRDTCLQCHQSGGTFGVPGLVVRSVFPDRTGMPVFSAGTFVTDHRSPLKERWGGWYVTGKSGSQPHMGNAFVTDRNSPETMQSGSAQSITDLRGFIETGAYLTPHSDIVALMTLEHQTQMVNLMTRVGWETRMALHDNDAMNEVLKRPAGELSDSTQRRINNAVEELLSYMLFREETPLKEPVTGTSGFAAEFEKAGPLDKKGRSLREFDMHTRMFRYPCSYMIYSDAFDGMPEAAKSRVYERLFGILTGKDSAGKDSSGKDSPSKDTSKTYAYLSSDQRQAILEILTDTKKGLPAYWREAKAVR